MVVKWTNKAGLRLNEIHEYYREVANEKVAKNMVREIVLSVRILAKHPQMAAIEPYLMNGSKVYHSMVVKHIYKIVYFIDEVKGNIVIATIWNCRQNPENMKKDMQE